MSGNEIKTRNFDAANAAGSKESHPHCNEPDCFPEREVLKDMSSDDGVSLRQMMLSPDGFVQSGHVRHQVNNSRYVPEINAKRAFNFSVSTTNIDDEGIVF